LEIIGWQQAEPVLRFVLRDVYSMGNRGKADPYFEPNLARIERELDRLPAGWAGDGYNRGATLELHALLRDGRPEEACELAMSQLLT